MSRKQWWIVAAVVAAALVFGAVVWAGQKPGSDSSRTKAAKNSETAEKDGTSTGAKPEETAGSGDQGEGSVSATRTASSTLTPETEGSTTRLPAQPGAPLKPVEKAPPRTLAVVQLSSGMKGDTYTINFQPFGLGPERGRTQTLVIRIAGAKQGSNVKKPLDLQGQNLLAQMAPNTKVDDVMGGAYSGKLTLIERQGLLVFELSEIGKPEDLKK